MQEYQDYETCVYCNRIVSSGDVPAVDDDAAWATLAEEHAEWCEWIATRAHRLDLSE